MRILVVPNGLAVIREGTARVTEGGEGGPFHGSSSAASVNDLLARDGTIELYLVRCVESKESIYASESVPDHDAAVHPAFLGDDGKQFLECALKCQYLLDVGALR